MASETFNDNPAEEDKNCSIHNIFTLLRNEEEVEELDVVLACTDSTAAAAAAAAVHHVDYANVADLLQWLDDNEWENWDDPNVDINRRGRSDDINFINKFGRTALHIASIYGASWEVINGLLGQLDEKVINAIDNYGSNVLHTACIYGASLEVINGLLGKLDGKVINAIDKRGCSALHDACIGRASWEVINGLLGKLDEKVINAINKDGETALHKACVKGTSWEVINAIMTHKIRKEQASVKNIYGKLPFDIFPDDKERRNEHLKHLLELHNLMEEKDSTASSYPNGLLQSILNLPSEDRDEFEFMNHSYFRKTINAKIIQPFSLFILFLDVAVQGLVMAVFSFTINGAVKELPTTSMAGLIPILLWLLFREIVQYLSATTKFYFGDAANFVDIIQIVLVIVVLLISFIGKAGIGEGLLVACIGVAWTRLIFVISNLHYSLALFVAALLQVSSSCYIDFTILAMM
jgi:ankyrin repeat protein